MRTAALAAVLFAAVPVLAAAPVLAGGLSKAEQKAYTAEVKAAYPGPVWALKDLPVKTGFTMMVAWVAPIAEVTGETITIDSTARTAMGYGSATSVWFGVRPNDTLELKDVEHDDGAVTVVFKGVGRSSGRDTKIRVRDATTFAAVKGAFEQLVTTVSPIEANADWTDEVKKAVEGRVLVNGMTKRQAYLVVGEPTEASTKEEDGKKVEIWKPRQNDGMRIGFGGSVTATGFPSEIRFEDGKLVGVATSSTGGVSLD